jgi:23S rRNA (adenine1618-N6)-methyltransferase
MSKIESRNIKSKSKLHPKNKHRGIYNYKALAKINLGLKDYIRRNQFGNLSIDFADAEAVYQLNKAILYDVYSIHYWELPEEYLCPAIPGRAEYIHQIAEIIKPKSENVRCLDIGTGASLIYPIVGVKEYNWNFVGVDIDKLAITSAQNIIDKNNGLKDKIELRKQSNDNAFFKGIVKENEQFDISICNPPFFTSQKAYDQANLRKINNLSEESNETPKSNFRGKDTELWCAGGEKRFIKSMIKESKEYANSIHWFSTLVSNNDNLKPINKSLEKVKAKDIKIIPIELGNKKSRILVWRF